MIMSLEELLRATARVQDLLRTKGWQFCFIGGIAVQRWGNPRFTQDIDLTLLAGFGREETFVDELLKHLDPREPNAREFALRSRVLLAQTRDGEQSVDVDIALGALPFEQRTVARASAWHIRPDISLATCSAEDLLVHKVFAGRNLDWGDVEQILIRQHGRLNLPQVRFELKPLLELKGEMESLDKFERTLVMVERRLRAKP